MVINKANPGQNRRHPQRTVNPYEADRTSKRSSISDIPKSVAGAFGDMANDAYSEFFGSSSSKNNTEQQEADRGGVRIPTFEQYRKDQEVKNRRFFEMKRQEQESSKRRQEAEDQRQLDAVYEELEKEIKRYEAQQKTMDGNIEKLKKLIIAERTNKYKKGKYAFTVAEIGKMILKTALINISDSNNWLEALMTKRKKRGSLFAARSKKQGTEYSMSQELSLTRSVQ